MMKFPFSKQENDIFTANKNTNINWLTHDEVSQMNIPAEIANIIEFTFNTRSFFTAGELQYILNLKGTERKLAIYRAAYNIAKEYHAPEEKIKDIVPTILALENEIQNKIDSASILEKANQKAILGSTANPYLLQYNDYVQYADILCENNAIATVTVNPTPVETKKETNIIVIEELPKGRKFKNV